MKKQSGHEGSSIIFIGDNTFLKVGLETLLEDKLHFQSHAKENYAGLLLLAPQGCSIETRKYMLKIARELHFFPGRKAIMLFDYRDKNSKRFCQLTGLPSVDLNMSADYILQRIIYYRNKPQKIPFDCVRSLTEKQWDAVCNILSNRKVSYRVHEKKLYSHRMSALSRIRLRNAHQLRILVTGL
ncbi:hypothetical protein KDH02_004730 [Salmonella enterica]|nr:hypothetical protein [Salmonella enterica subsp. enterica serovar Typhimurium]ECF0162547.1 hypothetical protein [Salmonella enterica subsp. enterica serovar Litchfield]EHL2886937.1 hypothetical protein [Salmonella enterica]